MYKLAAISYISCY